MAQATLNPAIEKIDKTSTLYDLYTRFYDGMTNANSTDTPDFVSDPIFVKNEDGTYKLDEEGAKIVDTVAMAEQMAGYSATLIKNSAYMMANAIVSTIDPDGGGDSGTGGTGFVSRSGDTMQGRFGALYGFEAGANNKKIFETFVDYDNRSNAVVTGDLTITSGDLKIDGGSVYLGGLQALYLDKNGTTLHLSEQKISLDGAVSVDGSFQVGDVKILETGITYADKYAYYHQGNCNKEDVDWAMRDAFVKRSLYVDSTSELTGTLHSNGGFVFSVANHDLLYSESSGDATPYMILNSDLSIVNNHGIKFDNNYIVWVRSIDGIVSFSAPGAVMNLGDKGTDNDGKDLVTKYIALQTDITNFNGAYTMISHDGSGNFPNGFSAGAANALGATFQTYYSGSSNYGVVSKGYFRFNASDGPGLSSDGKRLNATMPYIYVANDIQVHSDMGASFYADVSSSIVFNPTGNQSMAAMCFSTDAAHFLFTAPIEAAKFAIKSTKYKTHLGENVLFFDDGVFLEGMTGGMRLSGNSLFDDNLYSFNPGTSSISFSSGFAGSGWAIMEDVTAGGMHATFDSLTIRKKMRVYELEVQKVSVTNGSLWVSDSCSGDEVREII